MKTPYLIQRCKIERPLRRGRFSECIDCDYMGAAEFEWGALPQSLRALQAGVDNIKLTLEPLINMEDRALRVLHMFNEEEYLQYQQYLLQLREDKIRLKENSEFSLPKREYWKTDLWWDVENHVFWSFDKIFMNRFGDILVDTWKYMDEQKAIREAKK